MGLYLYVYCTSLKYFVVLGAESPKPGILLVIGAGLYRIPN